MAAADLAAADPLAAARTWLLSHPAVTAALGGPGRIGPRNEPPYPRLVLSDPPSGSDRGLRWLMAPALQLEVFGDIDGSPGKAELRRITYVILGALTELADMPPAPGAAVITNIESTGAAGFSPEPTGQPRYLATVRVWIHPPAA